MDRHPSGRGFPGFRKGCLGRPNVVATFWEFARIGTIVNFVHWVRSLLQKGFIKRAESETRFRPAHLSIATRTKRRTGGFLELL
jgi:hypothetical protein